MTYYSTFSTQVSFLIIINILGSYYQIYSKYKVINFIKSPTMQRKISKIHFRKDCYVSSGNKNTTNISNISICKNNIGDVEQKE